MGNCGSCMGKADSNEIITEKGSGKKIKASNAGADILINEIKKSGKTDDITKIQASFRGHQARKEVDILK